MGFTKYPFGVESFGIPLLGGGGTLPKMGGSGTVFFVDPAVGSNSNAGDSPSNALSTVTAAFNKCTADKGDTVYLLNDGNTSGSAREAAGIVWSKDNTHLVGLCAPSINQRARITPTSGSTDVDAYTPMITLSADGCIFANISVVQGNSEDGKASVGILVSGLRNYLYNVSILTGQHANQGDEASVSLRITGEENVVEKCYIGTDTIARGGNAVSMNVQFGSGATDQATRNVVRDSICAMFADDTEPLFVGATTENDVQRWNMMERCTFINTGTSTIAAAVDWTATSGILMLKDCAFYGMTDITAADNARVLLHGSVGAAGTDVDMGHFLSVNIA